VTVSSMTGFARGSGDHGELHWACEIKSVNGRGLDVRCRLPPGFEALELPVRTLAAERLARGSIQINLTMERRAGEAQLRINRPLLEQILKITAELGHLEGVAAARLDGILSLRGVLEFGDADPSEAERGALEASLLRDVADALDQLAAARKAEGRHLCKVIGDQISQIENLTGEASRLVSGAPEVYRARIKEQVALLLESTSALDPARLAQEAALIASRGDVTEELDRLRAHTQGARDLLAGSGPSGRKLEFLAQEFNREANTLCSKSSSVELTRIGLDLKAVIDQFREQIQNVE